MIKRIIAGVFVVLFVTTLIFAVMKISEGLENVVDDKWRIFGVIEVVFPWTISVICVFEILHNIFYFAFGGDKKTSAKTKMNVASLILIFASFLGISSILILILLPLLLLSYILIRAIYFVSVIHSEFCMN